MAQRRGRKSQRGRGTGEVIIESAAKGCMQGCARSLPKFIIVFGSTIYSFFISPPPFNSLKSFIINLICDYQSRISPKLNTKCLFEPSCSNYTIGAIKKYGLFKGLIKGVLRIFRCNPLNSKLEKIEDIP